MLRLQQLLLFKSEFFPLFGYFTTLQEEPVSLEPFVGMQNGCYRMATTEGSRDQAKAKDQTRRK